MVIGEHSLGQYKVVLHNIIFNIELVQVGTYGDGTPAVRAMDNGEVFGTLTVCIHGTQLERNEYLVKTWSENVWALDVLKTGAFADTGKRVPAGYTEAQVWRYLY